MRIGPRKRRRFQEALQLASYLQHPIISTNTGWTFLVKLERMHLMLN
jgi:hypothetical protein